MRFLVLCSVTIFCSSNVLFSQEAMPSMKLQTTPQTKSDTSPDLKTLPPRPVSEANENREMHRVLPVPLPKKSSKERRNAAKASEHAPTQAPKQLEITGLKSFPGIDVNQAGIRVNPPDTNGSVSKTTYVQTVNDAFAVFNKEDGTILSGHTEDGVFTPSPVDARSLWSGFGGGCESANGGDPIVLYDKVADRWLVSQLGMPQGGPYSECIAISTSPDASSRYYRYEFQFKKDASGSAPAFNDYPKFGVWLDTYYATFNMYKNPDGGSFYGARLCAFDRTKMLLGQKATMQCAQLPNTIGGVLPADIDGSAPPPALSSDYFLSIGDDLLRLWQMHVDWDSESNSTLTGPRLINVEPFDYFCPSETAKIPKPCVVQPNTSQRLDSLSDRLMYRLAYRNFGDHESLVVNHTVKAGNHSAIRWYELRNPSSESPRIYQSGSINFDNSFRWMGSIAMDKAGNLLLGYTISDNKTFPSIKFVGRDSSDPLGAMSLEAEFRKGTGSQEINRWGDYSSMSVDPVDDCTFWFTSQYQKATGTTNWSTSVTKVKIASCQ